MAGTPSLRSPGEITCAPRHQRFDHQEIRATGSCGRKTPLIGISRVADRANNGGRHARSAFGPWGTIPDSLLVASADHRGTVAVRRSPSHRGLPQDRAVVFRAAEARKSSFAVLCGANRSAAIVAAEPPGSIQLTQEEEAVHFMTRPGLGADRDAAQIGDEIPCLPGIEPARHQVPIGADAWSIATDPGVSSSRCPCC